MDPDRMMRNMMQSMGMGSPFGMFGAPGPFSMMHQAMMPHPMMSSPMMPQHMMPHPMMMDPFGMMQQGMMMAGTSSGPGFSYCSSNVTSYTTDEHGRPQVYQSSNEVKQGPGGVRETKSAVRDSRSGRQEMSIGHHIHEKGHVKRKAKNALTGEEEQAEDYVGIDETEADAFEHDWSRKARSFNQTHAHNQLENGRSHRGNRLAITSSEAQDQPYSPPLASPHSSSSHHSQGDKSSMKTKKKKLKLPKLLKGRSDQH